MPDQAPQERDYFTDQSVLLDPYDYFEEMFARGPVQRLQANLSTGYKAVILDAVDALSTDDSEARELLPLALHRAMSDLSRILLRTLPSREELLAVADLIGVLGHGARGQEGQGHKEQHQAQGEGRQRLGAVELLVAHQQGDDLHGYRGHRLKGVGR